MVKKLMYSLIFLAIGMQVQAQYAVDNVLRKYKNDEGVVAMNFSGDIASFLNEDGDHTIKSSIEKVDLILFNNGKDISESDQKKLQAGIEKDNYEVLIQARADGNNVKILGIEDGESIRKVFAQVNSKEVNLYFFLNGEIYFEDLKHIDAGKIMENFGGKNSSTGESDHSID